MKRLIHTPPERSDLITSIDRCLEIIAPEFIQGTVGYDLPGLMDESILDHKGRYLHWDDIKNKYQKHDVALAKWSIIKMARQPFFAAAFGYRCDYIATPNLLRVISLIDRRCTTAGLSELIEAYRLTDESIVDFSDEESIASSQLEGAATTRAIAKKMLQTDRRPRTEGEKMIACNQRLMSKAWLNRHEEMSIELLLDFHREATSDIDDKTYRPGQFRTTDDVHVADSLGNVIHTPPPAEEIKSYLRSLMNWANTHHEKETRWKHYMHPMIKAIILHFYIGYIHPFYDGNGRVARALCYWMLFKAGYSAFRYISISKLLKDAPKEYVRAYLRTETDDMDMTYFIEYQSRIIERAVNELITHIETSSLRINELRAWMAETGIMARLNNLQMNLINTIIYFPEREHTVSNTMEKYGVARKTALSALESLVTSGVMTKSGGSGRTPAIYTGRKSQEKLRTGLLNLLRS
ncbi:Fic family protein [Salmonella enterica]|nr:Fic family protein [Salmonella enterica]EJA5752351.1 Fic family protein [Salmonella enterica]EJX4153014.1 Fic family protein [Salmonella enterica]EJX4175598.1 Fic family protein [Salmonella enterica]EJX4665850.1 Fic family protein [Salmonella enterica]